MAFGELGIELEFRGEGANEKGYVAACQNYEYALPIGKEVVSVDPKYYRPTEVELLIGDATKARTKLGWEPKYNLQMLVSEMVQSDVELFRKEKLLQESGFAIRNQYE
jgi:GDPmannose 4,6-dehydratase